MILSFLPSHIKRGSPPAIHLAGNSTPRRGKKSERHVLRAWVLTIVVMSPRRPGEFHARNTERIGFQPSANFSARCTEALVRDRSVKTTAIARILISRISERYREVQKERHRKAIYFVLTESCRIEEIESKMPNVFFN